MQAQKFEKFIKLMKMTTSPVDGECLNAIRMANSFLMEANLDWDDFLRGKAKIIGGSASSQTIFTGKKYDNADDIERMLDAVLQNVRQGTSFYNFIHSLKEWWDDNSFLTEKQYAALRKTYERI
ncbi:hypothetical protein LCGC14_1758670 [marine sediment metagenome]|uniref:Uncharacterized protein n=1 Tax=marine sediment metagenome TaxID=412755 RepID=A0A0F9JGT6_9ZZZZ